MLFSRSFSFLIGLNPALKFTSLFYSLIDFSKNLKLPKILLNFKQLDLFFHIKLKTLLVGLKYFLIETRSLVFKSTLKLLYI